MTGTPLLTKFAELPYRQPPFSSRSWGHRLHNLCSYPSKLKPAIAHTLVQYFTEPGQTVLDPFAGIGTVPLAACLEGRIGIGVDLNPLGYWASIAKTNVPQPEAIRAVVAALADQLGHLDSADVLRREPFEEEIRQFFHEQTFAEVLTVRRYLLDRFRSAQSAEDRAALAFVGTCVAHILHGNRPYALSRRSHNIIPIPPKGDFEYKSLLSSLTKKLSSMYREPLTPQYSRGRALSGSVLDLPFEASTIDAVITSPPFLGTTEFLRQNRVRLWFCGWDYAHQAAQKAGGQFFDYFKTCDPYIDALREMNRVLKSGSLLIMHLGVVKKLDMGLEIEKLATASELFESLGIVYEDATDLETHGRVDRGSTHHHEFLFLRKK